MPQLRRTFTRLALVGAMLGVSSLAAAQHRTWYLAEGATNAFFQEEILIANPNAAQANVTLNFLKSTGEIVTVNRAIAPTSRFTLRVNEVAGLEDANSSVEVSSDVDILVERSMYWIGGDRRGGHNAVAVPAPAPRWFLAEGALGMFETFILVANPNNAATNVRVTFLRTDGTTAVVERTVQARSRDTVYVNGAVPDAGAFSTIVESLDGANILVERAMYWNGFEGGHDAFGVTAPSLSWRFAEGFTGTGFNTYLLLANPGSQPAQVRVRYLFENGQAPHEQIWDLAGTSRTTIDVNTYPELQDRTFSIVIESLNAIPIVAERAMYFGGFQDGHSTAGITAESTRWGFAEGLEDRFNEPGERQYESWYLLANATDSAAEITATFYREDGTGIVRTLVVPANARFTLSGKAYAELSNQRFAAFFESTNGVAFSAERAVYWGVGRTGGHGSTGTAWTVALAPPPAPAGPSIASLDRTSGTGAGGEVVIVTGANFHRDSQVLFGGVPAPFSLSVGAQHVVSITPPHAAGAVDVTVAGPHGNATLPGSFTFTEVAPPPPPPNRTPDPSPGQLLPLPSMAFVVNEVAAQFPGALRNSCQEHGGSWEFIDRLVDRLRTFDTRWGYNCKRGNCPDISQDVVAYHAGAGPDVPGAAETFTIDVIGGHCGPSPAAWWSPHAYAPGPGAARWHNRGRF